MKYTGFDKRMKEYEAVSKTRLCKKMPVIIRVDGRAFHTFTRGFNKPYDKVLCKSMQATMEYLCKNIQGCVFGYTQSDEITLILVDYEDIDQCAWFDYEVQKLCSIVSSMATLSFNKAFEKNVEEFIYTSDCYSKDYDKLVEIYTEARDKGAMFDTRCFNIPENDVCNNIIWRQKDAEKNSIASLGQAYFTQKELNGKNSSQIQDMLMLQKGVNWNDVPTKFKRGSGCIKIDGKWIIDNEIPIITKDRAYVENRCIF